MLREESDLAVLDPLTDLQPGMKAAASVERPSLTALTAARDCLETALDGNEAWRALRQLEAREVAGEWLDVMESDQLRDRLTQTLAADPEFMAWQFVDAAIACLDAGDRAGQVPSADAISWTDDAIDCLPTPPEADLPQSGVPELKVSSPLPTLPPPLPTTVARSAVGVPSAPQLLMDSAHVPPSALGGLALRIPTLLPRELKATDARSEPVETVHVPTVKPVQAVDLLNTEDDSSRFDAHAIGIEEAEVRIVTRTPTVPAMLNARLPPLPFSDRPAMPTSRPSRAPVAKWADNDPDEGDDYRPVSSAMDEAQVTIIATSDQNEARARAERRSLGVAPDREVQMRRFLRALSGD